MPSNLPGTRIYTSKLDPQTAKAQLIPFDLYFQSPLTTENLLTCFNKTTLHTPSEHDIKPIENIKGAHILLVEDIPFNQEVACMMLDELGVTADIAENGLEAIEQLKTGKHYDLIFMDCQMPELDGFDATREIRNGSAGDQVTDITIIALTANAMTTDKEKCLNAGMTDYLSKPIDILKLENMLNKHLSGRES